ncbi:g1 s-specific cyclin-e1 [Stylonychia lemnae]|uniref:G1 s-specific cyclin-e1 n=1 Tax=Stylonychia lemnae TaxID=5949 RepID=A0A078B7D2_STYLE|nr:g1 s-specific cyclin-e1 [Stylonychia lemnae]|eukprot:CDW89212.1 g1 s-specific cyclin-e1 [Stylonychia lemnae]
MSVEHEQFDQEQEQERQNLDEGVVLLSQNELEGINISQETNRIESTSSNFAIDEGQLGFVIDEDSNQNLSVLQLEMEKERKQQESQAQQKQRAQLSKFQLSYQKSTLIYLSQRAEQYKVDKNTIKKLNPQITPRNRQILIEWLMEVSDTFHLKRQTYQLAVNYIDRYLLVRKVLDLDQYQTLGITCLLMASKLEEIYFPKFNQYAEITQGNCNLKQMLLLETSILIELKWLLNPLTLNSWANFYMLKWDQYVYENPLALRLISYSQQDPELDPIPIFKSDENRDYSRFRRVMQALDLAITDIDHYEFNQGLLALSAIIIELSLSFQVLDHQSFDIHYQNKSNSHGQAVQNLGDYIFNKIFECDEQSEHFHMFINFIESFCDIRLADIKKSLRYIAIFFAVPCQEHLPEKLQEKQVPTQEEFYAFQVHYKNQSKIYEQIQLLKKYNDSSLRLVVI